MVTQIKVTAYEYDKWVDIPIDIVIPFKKTWGIEGGVMEEFKKYLLYQKEMIEIANRDSHV